MKLEKPHTVVAVQELPVTGERFVTQSAEEHIQVAYEHMHRYLFAQECCRGKDVLDIASGEGYGSNLLAQSAKSVVGVDISEDAVRHSRNKYKRANLKFLRGDCTKIPLGKQSVDVVVSFETIEHIAAHEKFAAEISRVLRKDGVLVISSPDKHEYSDRTGQINPFHVAELYRSDFLGLLGRFFRNIRSFQQRLVAGSYLAADDGKKGGVSYGTHRGNLQGGTFNQGVHEGLYVIAVCSNGPLPIVSAGIFENRFESARIWDCYERAKGVREEMSALRDRLNAEEKRAAKDKEMIQVLDRRAADLERDAKASEMLLKQHQELSGRQIEELRARILELDREAVARGEWGKRLDGEIESLRKMVADRDAEVSRLLDVIRSAENSHIREREELATRLAKSEKGEAGLTSEVDIELKKIALLNQQLLDSNKRILSLEAKASEQQSELESERNKLQSLENEYRIYRTTKENESQVASAETERLRESLTVQNSTLDAELEVSRRKLEASERNLSALESRLAELDREIVARGEWGKRLDGEIEALRNVVDEERDRSRQLEQKLLDQEADSSIRIASLNDRARIAEEESQTRAIEIAALINEKEHLSNQIEVLEQEKLAANEILEAAKRRFNDVCRENVELKNSAKELALKSEELSRELSRTEVKLSELRFEREKILQQGIEESQRLELEKTYLEAQSHRLSNQIIDKDEEVKALRISTLSKQQELEGVVKTLADELARLRGKFDSSCETWSAELSAYEEQLEEAQRQYNLVLDESERALKWGASLDKDLITLRAEMEIKERKIIGLEAELVGLRNQIVSLTDKLHKTSVELDAQKLKIHRIEASFTWKATKPLRLVEESIASQEENRP